MEQPTAFYMSPHVSASIVDVSNHQGKMGGGRVGTKLDSEFKVWNCPTKTSGELAD